MNTITGITGKTATQASTDMMVIAAIINAFGDMDEKSAQDAFDKVVAYKESTNSPKFTAAQFALYLQGPGRMVEDLYNDHRIKSIVNIANGKKPKVVSTTPATIQPKGWMRRTLDRVRSTRVTEKEISTALVASKENVGIQVEDRSGLTQASRQTPQVVPLSFDGPVSHREAKRNLLAALAFAVPAILIGFTAVLLTTSNKSTLSDKIVSSDIAARGYMDGRIRALEESVDKKFDLTRGDIAGVKTDVENITKVGGAIDTKLAALETRMNTRIDTRVESGIQKGLATSIKAAVAQITAAAAAQQDAQAAGETDTSGDSVAANPTK